MGRGKLKYRDIVGGGGKRSKNKQPRNNKQSKHKAKPRKTYSLYQKDNNNTDRKRKFANNRGNQVEKRPRIERLPPQVHEESSSEDEDEDYMKKLRTALAVNVPKKKSVAIVTSDESSEEEIESVIATNENEEIEPSEDVGELELKVSESEEEEVLEEAEELEKDIGNTEEDEKDNPDNDEDDVKDPQDPFIKHLFYDLPQHLLNSVQSVPPNLQNSIETWPVLGRISVHIPDAGKEVEEIKETTFTIEESKQYAAGGCIPSIIDPKSAKPSDLFIKSQIVNNLSKTNVSVKDDELFTPLQAELFSIINNYQDLSYNERTFDNAEEIRFVYCLHAVNHILKTRLKVIHHNARLSGRDDVPEEFRDQGLVRPKILIVVPFKHSAYKIIDTITKILLPEDKGNVMNKKRFLEEYTGDDLIMPKKNPKPEDYQRTFTGNTSDDFKIGITVTKKSLKLFANFYSSDIIIASPLGLRRIIGAEGEPERNYDFLASIEMLIMDQTELFLMQNWFHVLHIFAHLHLQLKESHGTNFFRARTWSLEGWAKYYRQTLIFSSMSTPLINSIFNKECRNFSGKIRVCNDVKLGSIGQVEVQLPHYFHKYEAGGAVEAIEARFNYFIDKILPRHRDPLMKQTLIFVPDYFDYVRIRNYFKKEEIEFVQVCEYSKENKIARARDMFYHGDAHFMLYTERNHFFKRIRVKGIRHLIFYQPPVFPHFYYEMCNLMRESNMNKKVGSDIYMTVTMLYSKYEAIQLAEILGTSRASTMINSHLAHRTQLMSQFQQEKETN